MHLTWTGISEPAALRHVAARARRAGRQGFGAVRRAIVLGRPHGYVRAAAGALIDRYRGVDTSGVVSLAKLGIPLEESVRYEPSSWRSLRRVLRVSDIGTDDVFLDIGSGKGRVLLEAARYPFRRLIGIEWSPDLNAIARRNVDLHPERVRVPVELHTGDATEFEIPSEATVVYLYNPFTGSLFRKVIDNLVRSVDQQPRTVRLICRAPAPAEQHALMDTGRFRPLKVALAPRPSLTWARRAALRLYSLEPQG